MLMDSETADWDDFSGAKGLESLPDKLPDEYFENLGAPNPGNSKTILEEYRLSKAYSELVSGSVLDIGTYFGSFLAKAQEDGKVIMGTEINEERAAISNKNLGEKAVSVDFRNGKLKNFDDNMYENVTALEVIEHVPDDETALTELCRVATEKVIITVPFREEQQTHLCVHCQNYTPSSGHFHRYEFGTIGKKIPNGWNVTTEQAFAGSLSKRIARRLPQQVPNSTGVKLMHLTDRICNSNNRWLLVTLEPDDE